MVALHLVNHAVEVTDGTHTAVVLAHDGDDGKVVTVQRQEETLCGEVDVSPRGLRLCACNTMGKWVCVCRGS